MRYLAFLSGPITGLSFDEAVTWREEFVEALNSGEGAGLITGLSPLRGQGHILANETEIAKSYDCTLLSPKGLTAQDYNDCKRSDVLVVNLLNTKKVSIGTAMEIAWAKAFQIPVILIMEKEGNLHDHPMINECVSFRVETVCEAIKITKHLFLPCGHR